MEFKARYESAFRTSGQAYASLRISAGLNSAGLINEATGGVSHYFKVLELLETAQNDWPSLLSRLEAMRSKMLKRASQATVVNLTGDKKSLRCGLGTARKLLLAIILIWNSVECPRLVLPLLVSSRQAERGLLRADASELRRQGRLVVQARRDDVGRR